MHIARLYRSTLYHAVVKLALVVPNAAHVAALVQKIVSPTSADTIALR